MDRLAQDLYELEGHFVFLSSKFQPISKLAARVVVNDVTDYQPSCISHVLFCTIVRMHWRLTLGGFAEVRIGSECR